MTTAGELPTPWHVQIAKVGPAKYATIGVVANGMAAEPCGALSVIEEQKLFARSNREFGNATLASQPNLQDVRKNVGFDDVMYTMCSGNRVV